ncbi:11746_t:CDS:2, partial [Racocetra fulgida]
PNARSVNDDKVRYNVIFKSKSGRDKHYKWLKNNYNKTVIKSKQSILSIKNKNTVNDFSADGLYGYTAWFTHEFASKKLKKRDEVAVVEKDFTMKINFVVPREIEKTVIPNINLDRIDKGSTLDEKFEFPDTAEFEERAKSGAFFCANCTSDGDQNGHGTNVAGIVAGKTFGVAKKSTVISVRVLNATGAVLSAGVFSKFDISVDSGTSQASPHVAGTIALIIAKSGNQSPAKMATTLNDLSFKNAVDFGGNKTLEKDTANNIVRIPAP